MQFDYRHKLGVVGLLVGVTALLWLFQPESGEELETPLPVAVATVPVRVADVQPLDRVTGRLVPSRTARLHFEVSGQVVGRAVEPGQRVAPGERLLDIEDGDLVDTLTEVQASLDQERAAIERDRRLLELVTAERRLQADEVARLQKLQQDSLASRSLHDDARQKLYRLQGDEARLAYAVETATARLSSRSAERNRAQRNFDRAHLVSPFAATVNDVAVEIGDYVAPGQVAVDLVRLDELDLYVEVAGETARNLEPGEIARVTVGDDVYSGKVIALAPDPDPRTHSHAVRIRLPGDRLAPGQLATADLALRPIQNAFAVPVTALIHEDGRHSVFVVEGDTLRRVTVRAGRRDGSWQVVRGLASGSVVVARDVAALTDGQLVTASDISGEMHMVDTARPGGRL